MTFDEWFNDLAKTEEDVWGSRDLMFMAWNAAQEQVLKKEQKKVAAILKKPIDYDEGY